MEKKLVYEQENMEQENMKDEKKLTQAEDMMYVHFLSGAGRKSYDIVYAEILNSVSAAVLITYLRDYQAEIKMESDEVIIKTDEEICKETALSEKELKEAKRKLKEKNWVKIKKITEQLYSYILNVEQFINDIEAYFNQNYK